MSNHEKGCTCGEAYGRRPDGALKCSYCLHGTREALWRERARRDLRQPKRWEDRETYSAGKPWAP